jgi:hypothetical protein
MLKKIFITAAAAAALSVPLAGTAWADPPSDPGSDSSGVGRGGIPKKFGDFADSVNLNPNGPGNPVPPGQEINIGKDLFPGVPTPTATGEFINGVYASIGVPTTFGPTPPGLAVKSFSPGCTSGKTATDPGVNNGGAICH